MPTNLCSNDRPASTQQSKSTTFIYIYRCRLCRALYTSRMGHTRKPVWIRGYICLFVCLTTKSVHLELVMDLCTEAFLAALRRFVAGRGTPSTLMTDNGTIFVGARRELSELYQLLSTTESKESVSQYLSDQRIECYTLQHVYPTSVEYGKQG